MQDILRQMNPWWGNDNFDTKIKREKYLDILEKNLGNQEILLLLGSRRVGKTTIMKQWIEYLIKNKIPSKNILYVLLDHPEFKKEKILDIVENFYSINNLSQKEKVFVFLDEIQYKKNWDQEVKALYETKNIKIILSGSAISLISRQKNFLTGRFLKYIVQPLSFEEFFLFRKGGDIKEYLVSGGYPEFVINRDPQYLLDLIDSIIYKDIVEAHRVRHPKAIKDILLILSRSVGFKISLNKISKTLNIAIETVREYLRLLSEVYLVYEVPKFSRSLNEQIYNEKKYYFYDTGLVHVLSGQINFGSLAENFVANYLKKENLDFGYFYEDKKECDFIIKKMNEKGEWDFLPIEVKFNPDKNQNLNLEEKGLIGFKKAMERVSGNNGVIIDNKNKKEGKIWFVSIADLHKFNLDKAFGFDLE